MDGRPKRRWLRFSVRTLLVAVTIFCVWLGWQVNIVRDRKAMMQRIEEAGGVGGAGFQSRKDPPMPWYRKKLGDSANAHIRVPWDWTAEQIAEVSALFPEATVHKQRPPADPSEVDSYDPQGTSDSLDDSFAPARAIQH